MATAPVYIRMAKQPTVNVVSICNFICAPAFAALERARVRELAVRFMVR